MDDKPRKPHSRQSNEGEGNKTAARRFNRMQRRFAETGRVDEKAREAERAVEGPEGRELERAEESARGHARREDPTLKRR